VDAALAGWSRSLLVSASALSNVVILDSGLFGMKALWLAAWHGFPLGWFPLRTDFGLLYFRSQLPENRLWLSELPTFPWSLACWSGRITP
jgi:hypothetical protein